MLLYRIKIYGPFIKYYPCKIINFRFRKSGSHYSKKYYNSAS